MKQGIRICIFGSLAIGCLATSPPLSAQIVPDATLPVNSVVTPQGNTLNITGGTLGAGGNLFHSFREFSLPAGSTAHFNNSSDIQNIITRVTGGSISNIDGLIRANGTANLFLLNPSGIIFGPEASLNIGGSFMGTTASSIKFAGGNEFSATNPAAPPLLTVNVPVGLQLGQNPGGIVVRGAGHNLSAELGTFAVIRDNRPAGLQVSAGKTLALVGGDISLVGGNITAEEGRITLVSAGAGSYVSLTPNSAGWVLDDSGVQNFQDIHLFQAASADVSGSGSGTIQVTGRRVTLSEGSIILGQTEGGNSGGPLSVRAAESVEAIGPTPDGLFPSGLSANVSPGATGTGGDLTVETGRLTLRDRAVITAHTSGAGDAGTLTVRARESVEAIGTPRDGLTLTGLYTLTAPNSTGKAGNLTVETGRLILRHGAEIAGGTFGAGDAGTLTVRARESVELIDSTLFSSANPGSTGSGGNVTVETGRLILRDGGQINTETFSVGKAGTLTVRARESVELIGISRSGVYASGLFVSAAPNSTGGSGGDLIVETGRLTVRDGAAIDATSFLTGAAGNLTVTASAIRLDNRASVTANTSAGGGNITLNAGTIQLRRNSGITTNAQSSSSGGNITLNTGTLAALENSDISANSQESFGGKVTISATGIFGTQYRLNSTPNSDITATGGNPLLNGTVTVNTPDADPTSGLVELQSNLVDISGLINHNPCSGVAKDSRFAFTGTGGIPPSPSDPLTGGTPLIDLGAPPQSRQPSQEQTIPKSPNPGSPPPLIEAQGWIISSTGTVTLTANPPTATPHGTWQVRANCPAIQ